jgi:hypothetical protein
MNQVNAYEQFPSARNTVCFLLVHWHTLMLAEISTALATLNTTFTAVKSHQMQVRIFHLLANRCCIPKTVLSWFPDAYFEIF